MSDIAIGRQKASNPFQAGAVALMLALGIVGFVGLLVLGAYAPDMRSGKNGGGHALSNSAAGFSGIVQLARATGRNPRIIRNEHEFDTEGLLVITPEAASVNISAASFNREGGPTLVVLPKWFTQPDPKHPGWVQWRDLLPEWEPIGVMAPGVRFTLNRYRSRGASLTTDAMLPSTVRFRAPRPLQVITGLQKPEKPKEGEKPPPPRRQPKLVPLITDGKGGIVLAQYRQWADVSCWRTRISCPIVAWPTSRQAASALGFARLAEQGIDRRGSLSMCRSMALAIRRAH